jgi:hypothetical protein
VADIPKLQAVIDSVNAQIVDPTAPFWVNGVKILLDKKMPTEAWQWYLIHSQTGV